MLDARGVDLIYKYQKDVHTKRLSNFFISNCQTARRQCIYHVNSPKSIGFGRIEYMKNVYDVPATRLLHPYLP